MRSAALAGVDETGNSGRGSVDRGLNLRHARLYRLFLSVLNTTREILRPARFC